RHFESRSCRDSTRPVVLPRLGLRILLSRGGERFSRHRRCTPFICSAGVRTMRAHHSVAAARAVVVGLTLILQTEVVSAQQVSADALRPLTFRHIGPVGNRVSSVAGIPGDPLTYYVGAASGG